MALMESNDSKLKHGSIAPGFHLKGTDGKMYSLSSFNGAKGLLVIFMCNHCPYVQAKIDEINNIAKAYNQRGLAVIGINSNDARAYPDDSFENMQKWADEKGFEFHYAYDESQQTAVAYGAACTPDPFLFDGNLRLIYHGRIDNGHGPNALATSYELKTAIEQLLSGKSITVEEHPSMGCSIKWK